MTRAFADSRKRLGAILLVLACLAAIVLWQASDGDDGESESTASPSPRSRSDASSTPPIPPTIKRPEPLQARSFALLRTPPEGLPAKIARALPSRTHGENFRLAQRIPAPAPPGFWLVPGHDTLCIVSPQEGPPGINCTTTEHALGYATGAVVFLGAGGPRGTPKRRVFVGVSPDPTRRIRVDTVDASATVPVTAGVYALRDRVIGSPDKLTPLCADGSRLKTSGFCGN
jgi:hypothetical protein